MPSYVLSNARSLKVAYQGPLLWTLRFFVRLQFVAMTRFACFPFFLSFFSATFLRLLHVSDAVSPTYKPSCGLLHIVFSVPYILSGARNFHLCFEMTEYIIVDPILACIVMVE